MDSKNGKVRRFPRVLNWSRSPRTGQFSAIMGTVSIRALSETNRGSGEQPFYVSLQFPGLLNPGEVPVHADLIQFTLRLDQSRIVKGLAFPVGADQCPVTGDHSADQLGGVFSTLHLKGLQTQVHVVPKFFSIDDKRNVRMAPDAGIDFFDFFISDGALPKHFTPLLIGEQAKPEATSASVRPAFVFDQFVSVFVQVCAFYIAVADQFVEKAVSDPADTSVSVYQQFGQKP